MSAAAMYAPDPRYPHHYEAAREYRPRPLSEVTFAADLVHPAPCAVCGLPFSNGVHFRR